MKSKVTLFLNNNDCNSATYFSNKACHVSNPLINNFRGAMLRFKLAILFYDKKLTATIRNLK